MSNAQTTQAIYAAFGSGDIGGVLSHLDPEVEWEKDTESHGVPILEPGRGIEHVARFFQELGALEFHTFEVRSIADGGETVVAVIWLEATVRATGKAIKNLECHVWEFGPDGKVVGFNHVVDRHKFVRAFELA